MIFRISNMTWYHQVRRNDRCDLFMIHMWVLFVMINDLMIHLVSVEVSIRMLIMVHIVMFYDNWL